MMNFKEALAGRRLLFDGSMGALLNAEGRGSDCPDRLNVDCPQVIENIHARYIEAGANVVITDSLGSTPLRLARAHLSERAAEFASAAVDNARRAADSRAFVALDIGPSGLFMQPMGSVSFDDMLASFAVCAEAGKKADLILLETMTDLAECRAACLAAKKTGLPVAASFTFSNGRTLSGSSPECCALAMSALGVCALGINCSTGPEQMVELLDAMRSVSALPVIVQPNAGLPEFDADGGAHYPYSPEKMLPWMQTLLDHGAAAIGGCCGTFPEHIRAFSGLDFSAPPASGWDGTVRICSARRVMTREQAARSAVEITDPDMLYDVEEGQCAVMTLPGRADEVYDYLMEALLATSEPLVFRCGQADVLEKALMYYPGVAGVIAADSLDEVCRRYGAVRL